MEYSGFPKCSKYSIMSSESFMWVKVIFIRQKPVLGNSNNQNEVCSHIVMIIVGYTSDESN